MKLWILLDDEPHGGYFAAQDWAPEMQHERYTIREVRLIEDFPEDLWHFILHEGGAPLDDDESNDSTWREWWPQGIPVWSRS